MPSQLQIAGAQPVKPSRYAPIFTNRFFTGLWTQRNPLREAAVQYLYERAWGGARHDSLIDGQNVELSNRLTLIRAPGTSVYNSSIFPAINSFVSFRTSTATTETVQVIADTASVVYDATGPSTKDAILNKTTGAGPAYFQPVGSTLFIADGAETKKYRLAMSPTSGALPNWGIAPPTKAPVNKPLGYVGEKCRYWAPNTSIQAGYTVLDANGNIQLMTGNSQQASSTTTTISASVGTQGTVPATLGVTEYGTVQQTFGFTPSSHAPSDDGYWSITDASLAVDGNPGTSASAWFMHNNYVCVGEWTFSYSGDTPTSLTLNVLSGISARELSGTPMTVGVWYSTDGGTTWTALWSQNSPAARPTQWDSVTLPPNTNIGNLIVCAYVQAHDDAAIQVYEINLVVGTTNISNATTSALTTGKTTPKWATSLYALTVDGQAIWQNQGPIGSWQPDTTYDSTGPTGAIVDANGNLQIVKSAGTTGSTDPGASTLTLTSVAVSGGDAVYAYSAVSGPAPAVGQTATISGFATSGNNVTAVITAVSAGVSITVATTTQVNETHAGTAQIGWATGVGQTTTDGTVVWLNCGPGQVVAFVGWQHAYSFHCTDEHVSTASPSTFSTGPVLGSIEIPLSGIGSPDTQYDQIWIWRTLDGGSTLMFDDAYGAGTMSVSAVSASGSNATYTFTPVSGALPHVGQPVLVAGMTNSANSGNFVITAVNIDTGEPANSTFTVVNGAGVTATGQSGTATTPSPGSGTWALKDVAADTDLNEFILAPVNHANDPPLYNMIAMAYHLGRIFGAVGNTVYYSGGPDTLTGDGNQAFPPLNYFRFPSAVRRMVPCALGLLVYTISDIFLIQGAGTVNSPLYPVPYILGVGLESYWELAINGSLIYFKSSDGQVLSLNPSAGMEQVGFPIGDKFKVGGGFN